MISKNITQLENDMSTLNRCNQILIENWQDVNAQAFETNCLQVISAAYDSFLSEVMSMNSELKRMKAELEEQKREFQKQQNEILDLCNKPDIEGCQLCLVNGTLGPRGNIKGSRKFIMTKSEYDLGMSQDEEQMMALGAERCPEMDEIESAFHISSI